MRFLGIVLLTYLCVSGARGGEGEGLGPGRQQWDFLELRPGAHMFYWLYYTLAVDAGLVATAEERPLVMWLQGGPGHSSTALGNFEQLGVLDVNLNERNTTWVNEVNVVFVDNPVATGFSYVENRTLVPQNNAEIAADLVTFTKLFLEKNPSFRETPFYIFSEAYGGKMAAEYALELQKAVEAGDIVMNFQGVALGGPWVSPIDSVMTWAPYLLHTGVIDYEEYDRITESAEEIREAVEAEEWSYATNLWTYTETLILRITDYVDFYNILYKVSTSTPTTSSNLGVDMYRRHLARSEPALDTLMNGLVRTTLGIPKDVVWDLQSGWVWGALRSDFMKPATTVVERLLNETTLDVVVFTGQLDLIVDTPGTVAWVQRLQWPGAASWQKASRKSLLVDSIVEGYVKEYGTFTFYWIVRSGHMIDQY